MSSANTQVLKPVKISRENSERSSFQGQGFQTNPSSVRVVTQPNMGDNDDISDDGDLDAVYHNMDSTAISNHMGKMTQ